MIGFASGVVIDIADPEKLGRVKVEFPGEGEEAPRTSWCRVATMMAGNDMGWVSIPEEGTEVAVGFLSQSGTAVVVGALHNGEDKPPYANDDGSNNLRLFMSRAGSQMVFDDSSGGEKVGLGAKCSKAGDATSGSVHQVMDATSGGLVQSSGGDVEYSAKGNVKITCASFEVKASANVSVEANLDAKISGAKTTIQGSAAVTAAAPQISLG